jgi:autotransporter-associated beta strand protein
MIGFQALSIHRCAVLCAAMAYLASRTAAVALAANLPSLDRPNIIVINTDDVGYNEFGFTAAGNQQTTPFETPRLDALAQQSSIITNGYVTNALCSPSRAGLMTGLYPQRFGYEDNISRGLNGEVDGLAAGQATIASVLKNLGYSTAAMGKWHLGPKDGVNRPQDVGFDEFYGFLGGGRSYFRYQGAGSTFDRNMLRGDDSVESTWAMEGDPSLYDPARGRYLTDALGEEAANYVGQRAGGEDPFFLYVALNATHTPFEVKQQDYDRFSHIANDSQRKLAAMSYAFDRAVGMILDSVESNGMSENTMIVYVNDNGGQGPHHSNTPYRGHKGSMFEGGIRVPFLIKAPGIEPGTYERPVSTLDLLPTFVSVAGGQPSQLATDGVDLLPYLREESAGDPHELLFWRSHDGRFAVRKGDWKLLSPSGQNPAVRLYNLAADPGEHTVVNSQHPEVVADLARELTLWEAQLHKAEWGSLGIRNKNNFDHFVYRPEQGATGVWSTPQRWLQSGTSTAVQLTPEDAYANAILEFPMTDAGGYVATNDMRRVTRYTFMLNEMRFTGAFGGTAAGQATIDGNALLMVKNLEGRLPRLSIDATRAGGADFQFQLDSELQLLDDLEITGDGTEPLLIAGPIRDYDRPRGVIKTGSSRVTLSGDSTFSGMLGVHGGQLKLEGASASIRGAAGIVVGNQGAFELVGGTVSVPTIDNTAGGVFDFHGGTLRTVNVLGNLVNDGGVFSPGPTFVRGSVTGNFTQNAGSLEIEIGGTYSSAQFDTLDVGGVARLGGKLDVKFHDGVAPAYGQVIQVLLAAGGIVGDFDEVSLPTTGNGLRFTTLRTENAYSLAVELTGDYNRDGSVDGGDYVLWRNTSGQYVPAGTGADGNRDGLINVFDRAVWKKFYNPASANLGLLGDYNRDELVDSGDYLVWRRMYGQSVVVGTGADGNRDGQVNELDFNLWRNNFGIVSQAGAGATTAAIPEPASYSLVALAILLAAITRRARR